MNAMIKKILLRTALLLCSATLLSGCVTSKQFRSMQLNMRNIDNRLVGMENQIDQVTSGGTSATQSLQKQQASLANEVENLNIEILQIQGQLDEARHHSQQLQEENLRLQKQLDNRLLNLEAANQQLTATSRKNVAQIADLEESITAIKAKIAAEAEKRAQQAIRAAEEARRRAAAAETARKSAAASSSKTKELTPRTHKVQKDDVTSTTPAGSARTDQSKKSSTEPSADKNAAEKLFDTGLGHYRSKEYKKAITTFTSFLDQYRDDKSLVADARFWLGASLLNSGDYSGAVLEFQNIVADYPDHAKAPEALLKQAEAFAHFGDKMVQRKLYTDVLTYYPDSEQATKAKELLKKLQ